MQVGVPKTPPCCGLSRPARLGQTRAVFAQCLDQRVRIQTAGRLPGGDRLHGRRASGTAEDIQPAAKAAGALRAEDLRKPRRLIGNIRATPGVRFRNVIREKRIKSARGAMVRFVNRPLDSPRGSSGVQIRGCSAQVLDASSSFGGDRAVRNTASCHDPGLPAIVPPRILNVYDTGHNGI